MRKLVIAIALLSFLGASIIYIIYRQRPLPTPIGWRAHVTTIAGDGSPAFRDGTEAAFSDPFGIAVTADGTVYVADAGENNRIRKIAPDGTVSTFAGGSEGFSDGTAAGASFNTPSGLALNKDGVLFVADTGNNRIRKITPHGQVSTIAGDGTAGYADGPAAQAKFNGPIGVAVDLRGNVFVADSYNDRIRIITTDGQVSTVAGQGTAGYADGDRNAALFDTPCGIITAADGSLIIADTGNDRLRKITPDGNVTTLAVTEALLGPLGVASSHDNFLYVTELDRSRIVQIAPDGSVRTVAGNSPGFADESAQPRFNQPTNVAIGPHSNKPAELYVADSGNYLIRKLAQTATVPTATPINDAPRLTRETLGQQSLLWPLTPQDRPHEVVATIGEVRGSFDSTDSRDHLHSGLDVFGAYGDVVRAVRSEKVTSPIPNWAFDSINEGVRVGIVSYIHIHVGRDKDGNMFDDSRFIPVTAAEQKLARVRIRRGTRFRPGEPLGTINRMYHIHMNIGPPGAEVNPLSLSPVGFSDSVSPTIEKDGIQLLDSSGTRITDKRGDHLFVSGPVRIVVDAFDRNDLNPDRRRLGLYKLGYQVLMPDGTPAPGFEEPRINILFNRLPGDAGATKLAYAAESGITVYGSKTTRFLYEVTNTVRDGRAASGVWDTGQLPKGDYVLRIIAADYSGNESQERRDVLVTVK